MDEEPSQIVSILREIRDLLVPISACFEERYAEIQQAKLEEEFLALQVLMTPVRKEIFPLLFDPAHLTQAEIAERTGTTQATVSRFVSALLDNELIEQEKHGDSLVYRDRFGLSERFGA